MSEREAPEFSNKPASVARGLVVYTDRDMSLPGYQFVGGRFVVEVNKIGLTDKGFFGSGYTGRVPAAERLEPMSLASLVARVAVEDPYLTNIGATEVEIRASLVKKAIEEAARMKTTLVMRELKISETPGVHSGRTDEELQSGMATLEQFQEDLLKKQSIDHSPGRRR